MAQSLGAYGVLCASPNYRLTDVLYFSAYATWRHEAFERHRLYIKALRSVGVEPVLGKCKKKDVACRTCGSSWISHEEKETDVNIAVQMVHRAYRDMYDVAIVVSADSDLIPPIKAVMENFPEKQVKLLTPSNHKRCGGLVAATGGREHHTKLTNTHFSRAQFYREVKIPTGHVVAIRPEKYDPVD